MITPFERGPDRSLELDDGDHRATTIDGYLLMIDERFDRVLAEFDDVPCWLPAGCTTWEVAESKPRLMDILIRTSDGRLFPSESAPDMGWASFIVPAWIVDNLDELSATRLIDRRREEMVAREIAKEAEQKRERRDQRKRVGQAAAAAKQKKQQLNLFDSVVAEFRKEG